MIRHVCFRISSQKKRRMLHFVVLVMCYIFWKSYIQILSTNWETPLWGKQQAVGDSDSGLDTRAPIIRVRRTAYQLLTEYRANGSVPIPCPNQDSEDYYRKKTEIINPLRYTMVLDTRRGFCSREIFLVIFVASLHENIERRNAIRETYAARKKLGRFRDTTGAQIRVLFVFGRHRTDGLNDRLTEEHATHGDIVQADFTESYANLTLKTLLGLKWVSERCAHARYVMKADDDIVVNVPAIVTLLTSRDYTQTVFGHCYDGSLVYRNRLPEGVLNLSQNSKRREMAWYVTCKDFPFATFPLYTSGHGYIMTSDLVRDVLMTSQTSRRLHIEDVYVTGVLRTIASNKTEVQCMPGFSRTEKPQPYADKDLHKAYTSVFSTRSEAQKLWRLFSENFQRSRDF